MTLRDNGASTTPEGDDLEEAISRQIALLWQTRALRTDRLFVTDEVENAVSFMRESFLPAMRSEEHTSELQSLMRISYAVFCLKKKKHYRIIISSDGHKNTKNNTIYT